jgi:Flp pilus assembly pilin Flp
MDILKKLWTEEEAQDIAEYAVMLGVILVLVVGTIRLIARIPTTYSQVSRVLFSRLYVRPIRPLRCRSRQLIRGAAVRCLSLHDDGVKRIAKRRKCQY